MRSLIAEHGASVGRELARLGVPPSDVDDATQDVFLVVSRRIHEYEERGRMRAWLRSICSRVASTHRRSLRRRREECLGDQPEQAIDATQLERVVDHEALAFGLQLLSNLPPEQRDVFWLYEVEELPMREVAGLTGCPIQTAFSRLRAARSRVLAAVSNSPNNGIDE